MKKGQLTIFIIVAIIIIGIAITLFLVLRNERGTDNPAYSESDSIAGFVQECLEITSKQAIYFIGLHGGYFIPPEESTNFGVPYYYYDYRMEVPSENEIESEISMFIEESLPLCTNNFEAFSDFDIEEGEINVDITIQDNSVIINTIYPIRISKGEESTLLNEFNTEISVRLKELYNASKFILNYQLYNHGEVCLNCLFDFSKENNIQINMQSNDTTVVYEIVDKESTLDIIKESEWELENYKFRFAIKY